MVLEIIIGPRGLWTHAGGPVQIQVFFNDPTVSILIIAAAAFASWIGVFGWVSRRFERQADTFAVLHIASETVDTDDDNTTPNSPRVITPEAINVMTQALQQVADLNHTPATRRSWRHGSIAWRQAYLRDLQGMSIGPLPIDRQVSAIKFATGATVIALINLQWWSVGWLDGLLAWL